MHNKSIISIHHVPDASILYFLPQIMQQGGKEQSIATLQAIAA